LQAIDGLRDSGVRLIVTVDCGIGNVAEVKHARQAGVDVLVTDHHSPPADLPEAVAVVNPKHPACGYPFKQLAGVGVAYKMAQALVSDMEPGRWPELENGLLDLVALGTVADVVPLLQENRSLVRRGLKVLNATTRPGLRELAALAGLPMGALDEGHIGFGLAPRLNAAGRIDDALVAYEVLVTRGTEEAQKKARILQSHNEQRQRLLESGLVQATTLAQEYLPAEPILVIDDDGFVPGVVGLIASRLTDDYGRPAVVIQREETVSRGSARSIAEFDIGAALSECADLLERHGGHSLAAGLTVRTENIPALRERLAAIAARELGGRRLQPVIPIDAELPLASADWDTLRSIAHLPPFGCGNPEPVFLGRRARVRDCRTVGRGGAHLRLALRDGEEQRAAVGFGLGRLAASLPREVDIAYTLAVNEWNGSRRLELRLKDLRPSQG
ncbi:MAG: single-stranded-DNA-specific exonuclease RecJ, partial [Chloroflexota bacterium]